MDNSTHTMSEKLVQYLDGEMTGPEMEIMQQQLAAEKSLFDDLESLKATREAVKMFGLRQKVSGIHQQMMQEMKAPARKISSSRRIIRYSIAVAASVVLIAGSLIGYNFYTLSSSKVFASQYHPYELGTVRDGGNLPESSVETTYRERNYKKVTELYAAGNFQSAKEIFLAGMSFVEQGDNNKAIIELKKLIAENDTARSGLLKDEAEYYLALTYIRNRDYDFALDLLRKINDNPEHLYHDKVTGKLIRQVKMLKWR